MFIILLAALEGQDADTVEAGMVDGANRWQVFRYISLPAILPVCATVILTGSSRRSRSSTSPTS